MVAISITQARANVVDMKVVVVKMKRGNHRFLDIQLEKMKKKN